MCESCDDNKHISITAQGQHQGISFKRENKTNALLVLASIVTNASDIKEIHGAKETHIQIAAMTKSIAEMKCRRRKQLNDKTSETRSKEENRGTMKTLDKMVCDKNFTRRKFVQFKLIIIIPFICLICVCMFV